MLIIGTMFLAAAMAVLLQENIEKVIAPSIIGMVLITNLLLAFNVVAAGAYIMICVEVVATMFFAYACIAKRELIQRYVFTIGGIAALLFLVILMVNSIGRSAVYGPDPMFWVGSIKKLTITGQKSEVVDIHPVFMRLLAYLAVKSWPRWSEGILLFSKDFFVVSLLVPLFGILKEKSLSCSKTVALLRYIALFLMIICIPFILDGDAFGIFSPDGLMAVVFAMALIQLAEAFKTDGYSDYFFAALYFCTAVLSKRIAIIIVSIILVWLIPYLLKKGKVFFSGILCLSVSASYLMLFQFSKFGFIPVCIFLISFLLNILKGIKLSEKIKRCPVEAAFGSVLAIMFVGLFIGRGFLSADDFIFSITSTYVKALLSPENHYVGQMIHIGIVGFVIICSLIAIYWFRINKQSETGKLLVGVLVTDVVYLGVMFFVFINIRGQYETTGLYLPGFERYVGFVVAFTCCFMLYCDIQYAGNMPKLIISLVMVLAFSNVPSAYDYFMHKPERISFNEFDKAGITVDASTSIAYIEMDMKDVTKLSALMLKYIETPVNYIDFKPYMEGVSEADIIELKKELADNEYIYIFELNDQFMEQYGEDVFGTTEITRGNVYRYDSEQEKVVKVGK